ncbi:probable 2,3-bisphosphoglycerate-independent phosphoglycerate mutase isoform X2 [Prunus dulcis]|uniref:probable 2,3-bisphosphoglycerate-independent phosphoglycerate mutase isoform X2 n=1 Tax=Prunus dulcis TaxID=3755 RepID=UPI00148232B6|nr:probable 2,3-bisphosphoglycerate-independent phosphoglycerate mutase isoform X2 [Prunus dulcis]
MGNPQQPKRRVAFLLIDGVGDVSIPKFGFKTPLQAAKVPNLDAIASAGVNGLMDPVEVGLGCGSDTAHLSLLGYDPRVYYRGRGAFESMGAGLAMSPGDIAFKSNFATLDERTGIVISRRADRHFEEEGPILCAALDGMKLPSFPEYEVRVRYATEHRCGVVVKGPNLSGNISGTDPLKDNRLLLQAEALDGTDEARHTAKVVNELSKEISHILVAHPLNAKRAAEGKNIANLVLLRGCGIRIEAIDDAGHDKATIFKVKALEAVDRAIGQLSRLLWESESAGNFKYFLCVTGDHSTPVEYGDHSFEPVPFTICPLKDFVDAVGVETILGGSLDPFPLPTVKDGEHLAEDVKIEHGERSKQPRAFRGDSVYEFNEIAAARGCLGRFPGGEMMGVIKNFLKLDA